MGLKKDKVIYRNELKLEIHVTDPTKWGKGLAWWW